MVIVVGLTTSREIWAALETNFASRSRAKIMHFKLQLQTVKNDTLPMRDYLNKIKSLCDLLVSAGCRVTEEDQILHTLGGLGGEYDSVMVAITSRGDTWSVQEVAALLLSFESRLETTKVSSINMDGSQPTANISQASGFKKEGGSNQGSDMNMGYNRGEGGRGSGFRGRGQLRPTCQFCQKPGHMAYNCWYRFQHNFTPQSASQSRQPPFNQKQGPPHMQPSANMVQARNHNFVLSQNIMWTLNPHLLGIQTLEPPTMCQMTSTI